MGNSGARQGYQGKVVCLLFMLTTCPHCQQAVQSLSEIQKEFGNKVFAVLAGTLNEDPDIPSFIQRFNPTFPIGEANKLAAFQYMQLSLKERPPFVPYMVFIDRKGTIRSQYTGSDKILDGPESGETSSRGSIQSCRREHHAREIEGQARDAISGRRSLLRYTQRVMRFRIFLLSALLGHWRFRRRSPAQVS